MADVMNTGIYCIEHIASGKKYIGSAINVPKRWKDHQRDLSEGKHHSRYLQRAWDKHGAEAFYFRKLLVCSKENLLMYEQLCIDGYLSAIPETGFNMCPTAGSSLGCKTSDETKAKQSASKRNMSAVTKEKMRRAKLGVKQSAEHIENRGVKKCGRKMPPRSLESRLLARDKSATKLTQAKADEIRELRARGLLLREIQQIYSVSRALVINTISGKHWGPLE